MNFDRVKTEDNSFTLYSDEYKQHYHSIHGACTESRHIFIDLGLKSIDKDEISVLEVGFGTGLNAILTYEENIIQGKKIFYHGIDVNPVSKEVFMQMEFEKFLSDKKTDFSLFYDNWNLEVNLNDKFVLLKQVVDLQLFTTERKYDVIYFDAFSPEVQPEMWSVETFKKLSTLLLTGGILVTYCSKGLVKENLRNSGFIVKRFPGPPGKRHVLRATKF